MDIKTLTKIAGNLPPHIAVLMRGPTGIGKSYFAKSVAEEAGLPFIDVRGSTMSEGDVGGYPDLEGMKESGVMTFCMPSWFIRACREPVVLMLDELNRSLPGVQQSFFQLVLDRELGNDKDGTPYKLHPDTRIIAAVNHGSEYDVNDMDPALLRRFWVCDLEPTVDDWISWAVENDVDSVLVDFIRQNPSHLRVDPASIEPGTVAPNPASWHRLATTLAHMNINPSDIAGEGHALLYSVSTGFVGVEASISFTEFVKQYEKVIRAEDILEGKVVDVSGEEASTVASIIERLGDHCKANEWSVDAANNLGAFAKNLTGEMMVQLWNKVTSTQNLANIQKLHKIIGQDVVKIVQSSRDIKG